MRGLSAAALGLVLLMAGPGFAQWITLRQPGTPRTPDGKADLAAPAPRTPDGRPTLAGLWARTRLPGSNTNIGTGIEVPFQPWAKALYEKRRAEDGRGTASERCLPHGITKAMSVYQPFKIIETPGLVLILYEEFNHHRQVYTDGRRVPANRKPTYFGYSRGRWDAGTFVIETTGFMDEQWLDFAGHPATTALTLTERYRRPDFGHLDIQFTIDDPKAYAKPWSVTLPYTLLADGEMIEHICDNEKDASQLVGK